MHTGERFAVSEIMLMHLSLDDYARLVVAHEDVRRMACAPAGEPSPDTERDTQRSIDTLPVPTAPTTPASSARAA